MTMTVGARSLDNEERSNFRDYMSLLSLSVDASMRAHETLERAGRHGGFPARGSASGLLAACPSDGSHDFYLSMMLDVPVPRVPMLRARLQDSRRGGAA